MLVPVESGDIRDFDPLLQRGLAWAIDGEGGYHLLKISVVVEMREQRTSMFRQRKHSFQRFRLPRGGGAGDGREPPFLR
jgi:hypothetical protein